MGGLEFVSLVILGYWFDDFGFGTQCLEVVGDRVLVRFGVLGVLWLGFL